MTQLATMGERIRAERETKSLTQSALADQMGMKTYATISKWESNDNVPRQEHLISLTEIFGVSADYLLGLDNNRQTPHPVVQASNKVAFQEQIQNNETEATKSDLDDNIKSLLEVFSTLKEKHQQKVIKYAKKQAKKA